MRNRLIYVTAALLLASATLAVAQTEPKKTTPPAAAPAATEAMPSGGTIDIGFRGTSTTGDAARYERYRDLRNGANVNLLYSRTTADWTFDVSATNVGYRDQRYKAGFNSRRVKLSLLVDQIPLNYSYDTRTPYTCGAGTCTIDAALRAQVQAKTAIGIPSTVAQLANPSSSIYEGASRPFDLQSRRDTIAGNVIVSATDNLDFTFAFNTFKRSGNMPWGASFAFPVGVELPLVIDNRTTDLSAGIEWASHQGMMRVAYDYSKFNQHIPSLIWDNPQFATDYNLNKTTVTGYDPSGYSNGNGPAQGRMAMPPTNSLATFSWMGMVKLPNRTTVNGSFSMGANKQDAALIPWTINPVIANSTVYAVFPGLAALERDTAQMAVNFATGTLNVNSRPNRFVTLAARYRFNSRSDFHPLFPAEEYVRFDAVPEETGGESEQFQINRNTLDVNASFTPIPYTNLRVGYTFDKWEHTTRATEGWKDNTARVSFDTIGNQYVTLRALFEHSKRSTIDLSIDDLVGAGMQPAARFFDEAARNRNRATFIVELNPTSIIGVNVSVATAKDDYQGADGTQRFGLLNNKNTVYTIGLNVAPSPTVNFGADYGRETYNALQQSRNASPLPDPSWTDSSRDWTLTNDEKVNNFSVYANLVKAIAKIDLRFAYDYSDSDQAFVHGGPRIAALTFVALPNVTNKWQRATVDLKYDISSKVAVGLGYWFEKFEVADFATINTTGSATLPAFGARTDTPRVDWLGELMTGYGNRPYKGSTFFGRVIVKL